MRAFAQFAVLAASLASAAYGGPSSLPGPAGISLLVPTSSLSLMGDKELGAIVEEYDRERARMPAEKVQLVRRGEEFSTLREFMARHLAGDAPAIAALEISELAALGKAGGLLIPPPDKLQKRVAILHDGAKSHSLPFQRVVPVLVANQDHAGFGPGGPGPLPSTWAELTSLAEKVARTGSNRAEGRALALPLQGPRGLWLFEALSGKPLWTREPGGLRANRALEPSVAALQAFFSDSRALSVPDQGWEQALKAFVDGKTPLLATSLDALPSIAAQASFRWAAAPLPRVSGGAALLQGGNSLVITRDDAAVWKFLDYLYSPEIAGRWSASAGLLPIAPDVLQSASWKKALPALHRIAEGTLKRGATALRAGAAGPARSSDEDVLRARSEWIQALHLLFGDPSRRVPLADVLTQLDGRLARSH